MADKDMAEMAATSVPENAAAHGAKPNRFGGLWPRRVTPQSAEAPAAVGDVAEAKFDVITPEDASGGATAMAIDVDAGIGPLGLTAETVEASNEAATVAEVTAQALADATGQAGTVVSPGEAAVAQGLSNWAGLWASQTLNLGSKAVGAATLQTLNLGTAAVGAVTPVVQTGAAATSEAWNFAFERVVDRWETTMERRHEAAARAGRVAPRGPVNDPTDGVRAWDKQLLQYTSLGWYELQLLEETRAEWERYYGASVDGKHFDAPPPLPVRPPGGPVELEVGVAEGTDVADGPSPVPTPQAATGNLVPGPAAEINLAKQEAASLDWIKSAAAGGDEDAQYHLASFGVPPGFEHADACHECNRPFNATRYRHHCRACGHSICGQHSAAKHLLPHLGFRVPMRVCTRCKPSLRRRDALQRVEWRYERVRAFLRSKLIPYFELEVDPDSAKARRAVDGVITAAKYTPLSASASIMIETVDLLRKYGYTGLAGLVMHREFTEAAELLKQVAGVEKKWPMKVHEMTAALYYLVGSSRGRRGADPDEEHRMHALAEDNASAEAGTAGQKADCADDDARSATASEAGTVPTAAWPAADASACPALGHAEDAGPTMHASVSEGMGAAAGADGDGRHPHIDVPEEEGGMGGRVIRGVADEDLHEIMRYAPFALHFLYGQHSPVETQLLARHQGWELIFVSLESNLNCPAFGLFANRAEKKACLAVRGTATITDVVTDIRARPVKFPPEYKDLDLPGWRPNSTPKEFPDAWQELGKATDGPRETLACMGMATAAEWLAAEVCTPLCLLYREGYEIVLTGHSLGAAVATLLGALLKGDQLLPELKVIGFSTPACTSRLLAEQCREFARHVVLHDDVIPRITPRGLRALVNEIVEANASNEWQPQLKEDLDALGERVRSVWAPRKRAAMRLTPTAGEGGESDEADEVTSPRPGGQEEKKESADKVPIVWVDDSAKVADSEGVPIAAFDTPAPDAADAETMHATLVAAEGAQPGVPQLELLVSEGAQGNDADISEALETGTDALANENIENAIERIREKAPTSADIATGADNATAGDAGSDDASRGASLIKDESGEGVMVPRPVLPEVYVPGDVLHVYSWHGVYKAAWVTFDHPELGRIKTLPNMLKDHAAHGVWEALREVCAVRRATEDPPRWVPYEAAKVCTCCHAEFTWASTLRSKAQEARDKHNCRACGGLVCAPCSTNRVSLPRYGLLEPSRVCDRCVFQLYQV